MRKNVCSLFCRRLSVSEVLFGSPHLLGSSCVWKKAGHYYDLDSLLKIILTFLFLLCCLREFETPNFVIC